MKSYDDWARELYEKSDKTHEGFKKIKWEFLGLHWQAFGLTTLNLVESFWKEPDSYLYFRKQPSAEIKMHSIELLFKSMPLPREREEEMTFWFKSNGGFESKAYCWMQFPETTQDLVKSVQKEFDIYLKISAALEKIERKKFRWW